MGIQVHGTCEPEFDEVKQIFTEHFKKGWDVGASFALFIGGKPIVDLWAGFMDAAKTKPWKENTIINVFSTTKIPTALCIHVLLDRGKLDLDAPVARYWPEFGQNDKEKVLVRNVLSHTSGVPHFETPIIMSDLFDWEKIVNILASSNLLWEPGKRSGYHMTNFGFLLGELVRRITGKTIGTFFKEEIAEPMDIDFHIGTPDALDDRIAEMIPPKHKTSMERLSESKLMQLLIPKPATKVISNPILDRKIPNTKEWRRAEIPASNGHGNGRSIAKIGSILACGGKIGNKRILSKEAVQTAITEEIDSKDLVLLGRKRFALGWELDTYQTKQGKKHEFFTWGGLGGSVCVMDCDARLSYGFAMNKLKISMREDKRLDRFKKAVYNCLVRM